LRASASFTISRGKTLVCVSVPLNASSEVMTRCCASSQIQRKTSCGQAEEVPHRPRRIERRALRQPGLEGAPGNLERSLEARALGRAESFHPAQVGSEKARQAVEVREQLPTEVDRAAPAHPAAEQHGEELCIGQRRGAIGKQALPRALGGRPVRNSHPCLTRRAPRR
jgi:hypothetical protein